MAVKVVMEITDELHAMNIVDHEAHMLWDDSADQAGQRDSRHSASVSNKSSIQAALWRHTDSIVIDMLVKSLEFVKNDDKQTTLLSPSGPMEVL